MDTKLLAKSMIMSAAITAMLLVVINIPSVFAATPPYYKGPYPQYKYDDEYILCAMLGMYDYENPPVKPYPCVLHQGYAYAFSPWELYGDLHLEYIAYDQSLNILYTGTKETQPGYCYYYGWPSSPYAYSEGTLTEQLYYNTVTHEIEDPGSVSIFLWGI